MRRNGSEIMIAHSPGIYNLRLLKAELVFGILYGNCCCWFRHFCKFFSSQTKEHTIWLAHGYSATLKSKVRIFIISELQLPSNTMCIYLRPFWMNLKDRWVYVCSIQHFTYYFHAHIFNSQNQMFQNYYRFLPVCAYNIVYVAKRRFPNKILLILLIPLSVCVYVVLPNICCQLLHIPNIN